MVSREADQTDQTDQTDHTGSFDTPVESLEAAWDGSSRRYVLCGSVGGSMISLALAVSQLLNPGSDGVDVWAATGFASFAVACLAGALLLTAPRTVGAVGPAVLHDGQVCLPRRRWREAALAISSVAGLVGVTCTALGSNPPRGSGFGVVALLVWVGWWLPRRWTSDLRLRLEPRGFTFHFWDKGIYVHWADVRGVEPHPRHTSLRILLRRGREVEIPLWGLRWTPSVLVPLLTYYAENPSARGELVDVEALEKFRSPSGDGPGQVGGVPRPRLG